MIKTKIIVKPKEASGGSAASGSSSSGYAGGYAAEAEYAERAGKASVADKAERAEQASTADYASDAGRARYANKAGELDDNAEVLGRYVRKDVDDEASGTITFEKIQKFLDGLMVGDSFSFSKDGAIIAHSIDIDELVARVNLIVQGTANFKRGLSAEALSSFLKGFTIGPDGAFHINELGEAKLQSLDVGDVKAWGEAILASLHVQGDSRFDGNIGSPDFASGFLGGKGWRLQNQPVANSAGTQENKYNLELDNLIVRGAMRIFEMVISQLLGENDNRIFTAMLEVDHYDADSGKVYLDTHEGRMINAFRPDDCILVQQYNGQPSADNNHYVTKSYELIVTEVGTEGEGENMLAWVKFKGFTSPIEGATPEQLIAKRDTFVRVDNLTDPNRKGIIQMMTVGADTPYMDIIHGLKTDPEDSLKGRLGNLQGIVHPIFGQLKGFGEFLQNLYATGDLILRRTGESVDTKIQMLESQFATRFAQTSYDMTEDDNYLHNGQFLLVTGDASSNQVIDGWSIDDSDDSDFWVDSDGLPVMVNGSASVGGNHRVSIENQEGRNVLRIQDSGISQANSLIRQPGTHKEYSAPAPSTAENGLTTTGDGCSEVQDTLYVSAIVYARTAGDLTIGFTPGPPNEGKANDLSARIITIAFSGEWQTVKIEGKWDGTGDFVMKYTGDILVSMLTVTTKPLDNLSKTVSTQIVQTAQNIKLLGQNIDKVNQASTNLGIELDAEKKEIRQYVDEVKKTADGAKESCANLTITVDGISSSVDTKISDAKGEITEAYNSAITQSANEIKTTVEAVKKTADSAATSYSELKQTVDGISSSVDTKISDAKGEITEAYNSAITQSANEIKTTVEAVKNTANSAATSYSELKQTVDEISTTVGKAATKEEMDDMKESIDLSMEATGEYYKELFENVDHDISLVRADYGSTITTVKQNHSGWSVASGMFDADGNLTDVGVACVTPTMTSICNSSIDDRKEEIRSGLVVSSDFTALQSEVAGHKASLTTCVRYNVLTGYISNAKLTADNIVLKGKTLSFGANEIEIHTHNFDLTSDGMVTAENARLSGFLYRSKTVITEESISEYLMEDVSGYNLLDIQKAGSWIVFKTGAQIYLPNIQGQVDSPSENVSGEFDLARSLVGTSILIYSECEQFESIGISGNTVSAEDGVVHFYSIGRGNFASLTCKAGLRNGRENIYWEVSVGKTQYPVG